MYILELSPFARGSSFNICCCVMLFFCAIIIIIIVTGRMIDLRTLGLFC